MNPKFQASSHLKHLAIFCGYTAWFVKDHVGNQNVGFLVTRLILIVSSVSTSNLPLPGNLLVLASGIETHRRGSMRGG